MIRRLVAEGLGAGLLLLAVVGSGMMAAALSGGNMGVALLANAIATGCTLYVLITVLGPISAAINPVVTPTGAIGR
jgi:glycerol uptake facilitator-like aquaporin